MQPIICECSQQQATIPLTWTPVQPVSPDGPSCECPGQPAAEWTSVSLTPPSDSAPVEETAAQAHNE